MEYKQRILVVDDSSENLHACEMILSKTGSEIIKVTSGNEALKAALRYDFAVALLDIRMPGMDGYELARFLRNDEKTKDLPIIFVSAVYTDELHIFKGYESGAVDFIAKPFDPQLLVSKVKVFLALDLQKQRLHKLIDELRKTNAELNRAEEALRKSHDELERRVEERTAELKESEKRLKHLSCRLLTAQEEERKRIACELHDSIGAALSGIKFSIELALTRGCRGCHPEVYESLKDLVPMIQRSIEDARRIYMNLRPSILDDLGILATLNWFDREFARIYPDFRIEKQIDIEEKDIPEALKIVIFRIIQEATNNSAKHSKGSLIELKLAKNGAGIGLTIRDNGRGFEPERLKFDFKPRKGLGLESMRERAELSGGMLTIDSAEGKGTEIRVLWPSNHV